LQQRRGRDPRTTLSRTVGMPSGRSPPPGASYDPVRLPPEPPPLQQRRGRDPRPRRGSPDCPHHLSGVPCPLPRRTKRVHMSISYPVRTALNAPYKACSSFTRVTARWIAQPPKAAFVTRLRSDQSPSRIARQLPDQSTTLWVESSSTGDTRRRAALHNPG
jgi:hypothetical protein